MIDCYLLDKSIANTDSLGDLFGSEDLGVWGGGVASSAQTLVAQIAIINLNPSSCYRCYCCTHLTNCIASGQPHDCHQSATQLFIFPLLL